MIMFIKKKEIYGRVGFDEIERMDTEKILEKLEELRNAYYEEEGDDESLEKEESNDDMEI